MTGGTSGFGAIAAERFRRSGQTHLLLGSRREAEHAESVVLDLARLDSVRAFAASVRSRLVDVPIDALVLNAGIVQPHSSGRTVDGFETTFAVNHLAHYLLLRLLLPALAHDATVVLTTSGTHDPATRAGLTPPRHADAKLLAHPDRDPDQHTDAKVAGEHAYTASKLCAVLTARWLSNQAMPGYRPLNVVAYCPGQVFGTGLAKDLSLPLRAAWAVLGTPLGTPLRSFNRNLNSRHAAGNALADLVCGVEASPTGHTYAALRRGRLTWPVPSEQARDDDLARKLWNESAVLVGPTD